MQATSTVSSTRVVSKAETASRVHLAYLDNLRILLIALVVLHHLAITCGGSGDFYGLAATNTSAISAAVLTLFTAINQSFFMGCFFLIAAYLTPRSFDRKGAAAFLTDRFKRLGIPLLAFVFVVNPLVTFAVAPLHGFHGSFLQFLSERTRAAFGVGPLWFVEALLLFALGYALFRQAARSTSTPPGRDGLHAPGNRSIALFTGALGIVTFIVRLVFPVGFWLEPLHLQVADFPQYIAMLCIGIVAYRNNWFAQLSDAQGRAWGWVALATLPTYFVLAVAGGALTGHVEPFMGGLSWQALSFALWEQIMGVALIVRLLVWFRGRFNRQNAIARTLSDATYAVYVFHAAVLVLLALALRTLPLDGGFKFLLLAPVALALSFGVGVFVKRLPLASEIL